MHFMKMFMHISVENWIIMRKWKVKRHIKIQKLQFGTREKDVREHMEAVGHRGTKGFGLGVHFFSTHNFNFSNIYSNCKIVYYM